MSNVFKKEKMIKIILISVIVVLLSLLILNIFIKHEERNLRLIAKEKNIELVKMKKVKEYDYEISITNQIDDMAVIRYDYNLNGKNNEQFYTNLDIAPVLDVFKDTGLRVISGHYYSFFDKLNTSDQNDILTLRNMKNNITEKFKFVKKENIKKTEGGSIYDKKLDGSKYLVTYTCGSTIFSLDSPTRTVVIWELMS